VNGSGHKLLARSGFSENQDVCVGVRDLFNLVEHIIDCIAFADDVFMIVYQFDFFLEIGPFSFEPVF